MAQIGWIFNETQRVLFDDAITEAETHGDYSGWPYEVLVGMKEQLTKPRPDGITVTTLLSNPRHAALEKQVEFFDTPDNNYATFRGSLIHEIMERYGGADSTIEQRVSREFQGITISGQPDTVQLRGIEGRTLLRDWKSTKDLPRYDSAYTNHQRQVNLYRWLLQLDPATTDLEVVYVSMVGVKIARLKHGGRTARNRAIPEQHWSDEQVEEFITQRLDLFDRDGILPYNEIPEDDLWMCNYSPVEYLCRRLAIKEAAKVANE